MLKKADERVVGQIIFHENRITSKELVSESLFLLKSNSDYKCI